MLQKTDAILLSTVKYGDSSLIVKAYTKEFGLMSFITGGARGKKGPFKSSMAMPLTQLNLVYYTSSKTTLSRIKEANYLKTYKSIGTHPIKNCVAMFLAELLNHVLHEEESNKPLFSFLCTQFYAVDAAEQVGNLHLAFCLNLCNFLGFAPDVFDAVYFDLLLGSATDVEPAHSHYITGVVWQDWRALQQQDANLVKLNSKRRNDVLNAILLFYRHHVKDFGTLKSVEVIQSVLH